MWALEEGDLNEYNQSQTQLKELYGLLTGQKGTGMGRGQDKRKQQWSKGDDGLKHQNEFIAYRIIYYVLMTGNKKYEGGSTDLFRIMLDLTPQQRKDPAIIHALKVRVAVADNDYHAFFRLQDECPNLGAYLMDTMVPQMRGIALKCMVKAYLPTLSVHFILEELGFSFKGVLDRKEGLGWLGDCGCKFNEDQSIIKTKESVLNESFLAGNRSSSLI